MFDNNDLDCSCMLNIFGGFHEISNSEYLLPNMQIRDILSKKWFSKFVGSIIISEGNGGSAKNPTLNRTLGVKH